MKLALRRDAPTSATVTQKLVCWVIQARLVSQYSHGGIVIDGDLYQITASKGWQKIEVGDWSPEKWNLVDFEGDESKVKELFAQKAQPPAGKIKRLLWKLLKGYDWFGLLAFTGPRVRVSWMDYCFEWCFLAITGQAPNGRVTPETLLVKCLKI